MKFTAALVFAPLLVAAIPKAAFPVMHIESRRAYNGTKPATPEITTQPTWGSPNTATVTNLIARAITEDRTLEVDSIETVSFSIDGKTTCTADNPDDGETYACEDAAFTFEIDEGEVSDVATRFPITLYSESATG